ncbi:prepilin peptidase [Candidatus Giovannonibacteria bacterium]|nr:prepilin peptidase [Candidatus Giovannonibacteria bacterium]
MLYFWIYWLIVFVLGLSVGSFINSFVLRYNTGEKIANERSRCFKCGHALGWRELIPIFSFILLKGRCKSCQSVISWQYPAVEILTGLVFLGFYIEWVNKYSSGGYGALVYLLLFASILIAISLYDLMHKIIPDSFSYFLAAVALLGNFIFFNINLYELLLSLIPAGFLFFLWLFSRGKWMGLGDAKLMVGGGIFLGVRTSLAALMIGFWIGALFGIFLLLTNPKTTIKSEIPFGPFLALGIVIAFLFSDYLDLLTIFYA